MKSLIAILINNIIILALWVILAIVFNKWWIVFFSMLFFDTIETNKEWLNDNTAKNEWIWKK